MRDRSTGHVTSRTQSRDMQVILSSAIFATTLLTRACGACQLLYAVCSSNQCSIAREEINDANSTISEVFNHHIKCSCTASLSTIYRSDVRESMHQA